jgi:hypothetical protein
MERYIVWHMEVGRTLLKPGVMAGLVVYDMNGFGLKNMASLPQFSSHDENENLIS